MFWTIVGALLFVFIGLPIIIYGIIFFFGLISNNGNKVENKKPITMQNLRNNKKVRIGVIIVLLIVVVILYIW